MKAKEKAKQLIESFLHDTFDKYYGENFMNEDEAQQCALITVDIVINNDYGSKEQMEFWMEVRQCVITYDLTEFY